MKIRKLKDAAMMLLCAMLVMSVSSCHDDDDKTTTTNDDNAGTFTVKNITSEEEIDDNPYLFLNDTIKVSFTPKEQYKSKKFKIECTTSNIDYLKKINDSIFVVGVQRETPVNPSLMMSASYNNSENNIVYNLTAKKTIFMGGAHLNSSTRQDWYGHVGFGIEISSNLLTIVEPVPTFTYGQGNTHNIDNVQGGSNTVSVYKDSNNKLHYFNDWSIDEPEKNWSKIQEYSYTVWGTHFGETYALGREYDVLTVTYNPTNITPTGDSFIFVRNIYYEARSNYNNIITIDTVSKDKLPAYIDFLTSNPDKLRLSFTKRGEISEL